MSYKQILVHLDHSKACESRLTIACELAQRLESRLISVFVVPDFIIPTYVEAQISNEVMESLAQQAVEEAEKKLEDYRKIASEHGVAMENHIVEGEMQQILNEHSKYVDLVIAGQHDADDADDVSAGVVDQLLIEGGTRCLVVPARGHLPAPGQRVLIAWNSSREAARAVRAALPLMANAEEVVVLSSETADEEMHTGRSHSRELSRYLDAHGIESVVSSFDQKSIGAGEAIIAQAADMRADLIVMGGYGHTRLREIILGGATRELLESTPCCLMLCH